jgi:hypothetical protein
MSYYVKLLTRRRELEDRLLDAKTRFDRDLDRSAPLGIRQTLWREFLRSPQVIALSGLLKDTEETLGRVA